MKTLPDPSAESRVRRLSQKHFPEQSMQGQLQQRIEQCHVCSKKSKTTGKAIKKLSS